MAWNLHGDTEDDVQKIVGVLKQSASDLKAMEWAPSPRRVGVAFKGQLGN